MAQNDEEAMQWLQKAADNGHALAQLNLGVWLFDVAAEAFPKILPKALAAEAFPRILPKVEKALAASHKYLVLAAKQGNETAKQAIKERFKSIQEVLGPCEEAENTATTKSAASRD